VLESRLAVCPSWVRQQLEDVAGLIGDVPEHAKAEFRRLNIGFVLHPVHDEGTAQSLRAIVAKGAMPPLVLVVKDCRAAYDRMREKGVEFMQEPIDRFGTVDAGFRDPSGNGWKMIQARG